MGDQGPVSAALDIGERQVILTALRMRADLVLVDERAGAAEARRLGLTVTGTLGVIARSAERGWLDLKPAFDSLQKTNFRVHPNVINTEFWIDPVQHMGGVMMMQVLPFYDDGALQTLRDFEQLVYRDLR